MIVWIYSTRRTDKNCMRFSSKFWSEGTIWDVQSYVDGEVKMDVIQMLCENVDWIYLAHRGRVGNLKITRHDPT